MTSSTYRLGIDVGTTYTAAAVAQAGTSTIVKLGTDRVDIPSTVFLAPDGSILVGEAAEAAGRERPTALARAFKRRMGDEVPILIDGRPFSAQSLMAHVLRHVVQRVAETQGQLPELLTVTCPADWGPFKHDALTQAVRMAEVPSTIICTEPEAAAIRHAGVDAQREGALVGVYDLGGGTMDAALLRATRTGAFALAGKPGGIEAGGIDFDQALFNHALKTLGLEALDVAAAEDLEMASAMADLRRRCVVAKEQLSIEQAVTIEAVLPGVSTAVRVTRWEFEAMIGPAIDETVRAFNRALANAGVEAGALTSLVLVGGSVRIPFVFEAVSRSVDCQVVMPREPAHSVALGAAMAAARYRIPRPTSTGGRPLLRRSAAGSPEPAEARPPSRDATVSARELLRLGSADRAHLTRWLVEPGSTVCVGQAVGELTVVRSQRWRRTVVLRSPFEGVLNRYFVSAGSSVESDDLLAGFHSVSAYLMRSSRVLDDDTGVVITLCQPTSPTAVAGRPVVFVDRQPKGFWWGGTFCLLLTPGRHQISVAYFRGNQSFGRASQTVEVAGSGLVDLVYTDPGSGATAQLGARVRPGSTAALEVAG